MEHSFTKKGLQALLALILFFGPLIAVETWVTSRVEWIYPQMRHFHYAGDLKRMILHARETCPDAIFAGTSLTDRGLPPRFFKGAIVDGEAIEAPFDFAGSELRPTHSLSMWRDLVSSGCRPRVLLVEISPVVLNGARSGAKLHDPVFMNASNLGVMPQGFLQVRGYSIKDVFELATYERLFIFRRREQVFQQIQEDFEKLTGLTTSIDTPKELRRRKKQLRFTGRKIPQDGKLSGWDNTLLDAKGWKKERARRKRRLKRQQVLYRQNPVEVDALFELIREAELVGTTVILHSPPVTKIYTDLLKSVGAWRPYLRFTEHLEQLEGVRWYDALQSRNYGGKAFTDHAHLSRAGARKYAARLKKQLAAGAVRGRRRG